MNVIFNKKVTGCDSGLIRSLIQDMIHCIKEWNPISENDEYEFKLILNELIANSTVHGNKMLCTKTITARIEAVDNETVSIMIQDEGAGFDHKEICGGAYPCDMTPYSERGRGLKLIRAMCSGIMFNKTGNQVRIYKSVNQNHR